MGTPIKTQLPLIRLKFSVNACDNDAAYALYGLLLYKLIGRFNAL